MRFIAVAKVAQVYIAGKGDTDILLELSDAPGEEPKTFQAVRLLLFRSFSLTLLQAVQSLYEIGEGINSSSRISTVRGMTSL